MFGARLWNIFSIRRHEDWFVIRKKSLNEIYYSLLFFITMSNTYSLFRVRTIHC